MFFPKAISSEVLENEELKKDKRNCLKIGPIGIGEKAIYLNSFYLDRIYYIPFTKVNRVYKRVAMSKGGYSGKGIFASIPYLVVEYDNGKEKQCNFKFEQLVDMAIEEIKKRFPNISIHSEKAEKRLREAEIEEEKRYKKDLSDLALKSISQLKKYDEKLNEKPELYLSLSRTAKTKRMAAYTNPFYKHVQIVIFIASLIALIMAFYSYKMGQGFSMYFVLFGFAAIFMYVSLRIRPTGIKNKENADIDWIKSVDNMSKYISSFNLELSIPPEYSHTYTIKRMIRIIREGRTESIDEALDLLKDDLKKINSSVKVSQSEYEEIVNIKPMFLCMDYR